MFSVCVCVCVCVSVCVHSIIHIVWGCVVIKMCLVKVLVLCVSVQLYGCVLEIYMSHSNGGVGGALLEIVVGKLWVCVCVL